MHLQKEIPMKSTLLILACFGGSISFAGESIAPFHGGFESTSLEQLVTIAHTNMNMDIHLSVLLNKKSIDFIHIKGKTFDKTFDTRELKEGIVILNMGGDLVKLQSENFDPLAGGDINMDYLKDKKTGHWERAQFSVAYNQEEKVALYQENPFTLCEIDYLNFEFAKSNIGLPKGVNSIKGTCKTTNF